MLGRNLSMIFQANEKWSSARPWPTQIASATLSGTFLAETSIDAGVNLTV